jgi:Family of unknown function (DUF5677)
MTTEARIEAEKRRREIIKKDSEALIGLVTIASGLLLPTQSENLQRVLRYFAVSLVNSSFSISSLCCDGYGVDAMKIGRGMFETFVSFRYLLVRRKELDDFLEFDAVIRYKRLQVWSRMPRHNAGFAADRIEAVNSAYRVVKKKFTNSKGKARDHWCRHSLAEMARVAGSDVAALYDVFYRHASLLHHTDPMGLSMLIKKETMEIQPGPTENFIGIAMRLATIILHDTLEHYSKFAGIDCSGELLRIGETLNSPVHSRWDGLETIWEAFW